MSIVKELLNYEIREIIRGNANLSNKEISDMFENGKVSPFKVRANRAHVTMGTDTDTPMQRKKALRTSKNETYFGLKKLDARNLKVKAIGDSLLLSGKILTLCGTSLVIEKTLYRKKLRDFSYDFVENNRDNFDNILSSLVGSPLNINSVNFNTMNNMIHNANTDEYSHLILDYCNTLNANKSEIDMALANNIVKVGGTVCMTFSMRIKPIMETEKVEGESANMSGAKKYFSRFENYELVEEFTYRDGSPMMVLILKRVK